MKLQRPNFASLSLRILPPLGFAGLVIGVWYLFHYVVLSERRRILLPTPDQVLSEAFLDSDTQSRLLEALRHTGTLSMTGLLFAILMGMLMAVIMNFARPAERALYPWAVVLQTVPILALIRVIDVWFNNVDPWFFGYSPEFKKRLLVCVLIAVFPIITNTFFGLRSADKNVHELLTLHRSSRLVRVWKVELPASMPAVFTGFRIAAGLSVIGAIVAEFLFARGGSGIGNLINRYRGFGDYEELYATILVSSLLGIVVFWIFGFFGYMVARNWHASARQP